jgi:hypothetical protein
LPSGPRGWGSPGHWFGRSAAVRASEGSEGEDRVRRRQASYIPIVLSKAALSGPSVCLRARAPCPLRVSYLRPDRARACSVAAGCGVLVPRG